MSSSCKSSDGHLDLRKKSFVRAKFVSETLDLRKGVLLTKKPELGNC